MNQFILKYLCLIFISILFQSSTGSPVFKAHQSFYTQYISLGTVAATSEIRIIPLSQPQNNIVRFQLILSQLSKPIDQDIEFDAFLTLGSNNPCDYVELDLTVFTSVIKLGFFALLIKTQTTSVYIDLITVDIQSGSGIDSADNFIRTSTNVYDINALTQFATSVSSTLQYVSLFRCMNIKLRDPNNLPTTGQMNIAMTASSTSSSQISAVVTVSPFNQVAYFHGIVLIYDLLLISAQSTTAAINVKFIYDDIGGTSGGPAANYYLSTYFSSFGPSFNKKCLFGFESLIYGAAQQFQFEFFLDGDKNLFQYQQSKVTFASISPFIVFDMFCFGKDLECSANLDYLDPIDNLCYDESTCPLPLPPTWLYPNKCPWCHQLICGKCDLADRSQCIDCNSSMHAQSTGVGTGVCQCMPGYDPVYQPLLLNWGSLVEYLDHCQYNCTTIDGCKQKKCTSQTYCTQCYVGSIISINSISSIGYYLQYIDPTHQYCQLCNSAKPSCVSCTAQLLCDVCQYGYYIVRTVDANNMDVQRSCDSCALAFTDCIGCSSDVQCGDCPPGFALAPDRQSCVCDTAPFGRCVSCTTSATCDACYNGYYLLPASMGGKCVVCSASIPHCLQCSNQLTCTKCDTSYFIDSSSGNQLCSACIPNCAQCTSQVSCGTCLPSFGISSSGTCQKCQSLLSTVGCIQCTNYLSPCLNCDPLAFAISSVCYYCRVQFPNCKICSVNTGLSILQCDSCKYGYYLTVNPGTGKQQCIQCNIITTECQQCLDQYTCTQCTFPRAVDATFACGDCQNGYTLQNGTCTNKNGCVSSVTVGITNICLSCQNIDHFIYEPLNHSCICTQGYYLETIDGAKTCISKCGDGILVVPEEFCDDNNLVNYDGCSSSCEVQSNFKCFNYFQKLSRCVLYVSFRTFDYGYAEKVEEANQAILHFKIQPAEVGLQTVAWQKLLTFNFSKTAVKKNQMKYAYSYETAELKITFPYYEELEDIDLQSNIAFDPNIIVSNPSSYKIINKLNGVNSPLKFKTSQLLQNQKVASFMTLIISVILLIQFYMGSYFNKMIGLQTIQLFQIFYFSRILIQNKNSSGILNALNVLEYSISGYVNADVLFGQTQGIIPSNDPTVPSSFLNLGMQKYFLLNVNFAFIPLIIAIIIYIISLIRKYNLRHQYIKTKQLSKKAKYTESRRSSQWIYDHFVFPYLMMLNFVVYFSAFICLLSTNTNSSQSSIVQNIQLSSSTAQALITFITFSLISYEIFISYQDFIKLKSKQAPPVSFIETLEHDENYTDRPNYHPFYIFIYLNYYFLFALLISFGVLVKGFHYGLQVLILLSGVYFIGICMFPPYFKATNWHNNILKLNSGFVIIYLILCEVYNRNPNLSQLASITMIYLIIAMLFAILVCSFIRIYIEFNYRKRLGYKKSNFKGQFDQATEKERGNLVTIKDKKNKKEIEKSKKQALISNNSYVFKNQLNQLKVKYFPNKTTEQDNLTSQQQQFLINKIKQQYRCKVNFYEQFQINNQRIEKQNKKAKSNFKHRTREQNDSLNLKQHIRFDQQRDYEDKIMQVQQRGIIEQINQISKQYDTYSPSSNSYKYQNTEHNSKNNNNSSIFNKKIHNQMQIEELNALKTKMKRKFNQNYEITNNK